MTNAGKIYNINLKYPNFSHSMLIGNGSDIKVRFLEIKCDDGTIFHLDGFSKEPLKINFQPYLEVSHNTPMENMLENFINGIEHGQYDDRWGLDLGRKVVKLASDCEKKLLNNLASY